MIRFGWFVTMLGVVRLVSACAKLVSILSIWSNPAQVKEHLRQCLVAMAIGIGLRERIRPWFVAASRKRRQASRGLAPPTSVTRWAT
jgi:hypothetical protein